MNAAHWSQAMRARGRNGARSYGRMERNISAMMPVSGIVTQTIRERPRHFGRLHADIPF